MLNPTVCSRRTFGTPGNCLESSVDDASYFDYAGVELLWRRRVRDCPACAFEVPPPLFSHAYRCSALRASHHSSLPIKSIRCCRTFLPFSPSISLSPFSDRTARDKHATRSTSAQVERVQRAWIKSRSLSVPIRITSVRAAEPIPRTTQLPTSQVSA